MERWQGEQLVSSPYLPPRELWLFTPGVDEKLPTPVDDRGIVETQKLIDLVKTTVDPSYSWDTSKKSNIHHFFFEHNKYRSDPEAFVDPEKFCELAINKIFLPRKFHAWLHKVMAEPPVPSEETMYYRILMQDVSSRLFRTAEQSEQLMHARYITDEKLQRGLTWHFQDFNRIIDYAQRTIPPEFHPYDLSLFQPETETDLHKIVPTLGRMALSDTFTREVARPVAA